MAGIIQIAALSGDSAWGQSIGQNASKHAVFTKVEILQTGSSAAAVKIIASVLTAVAAAVGISALQGIVAPSGAMAASLPEEVGTAAVVGQTIADVASANAPSLMNLPGIAALILASLFIALLTWFRLSREARETTLTEVKDVLSRAKLSEHAANLARNTRGLFTSVPLPYWLSASGRRRVQEQDQKLATQVALIASA
jgi:hypothetical protein